MKLALIIIFAAAVSRLFSHPANFAPIAGIALFGSVYLPKKFAFLLPLAAMFISDIFLGFHSTMPWVYGSFVLTTLIGLYLKNHQSYFNIFIASLSSSLLFYFLTNFGVWASSAMYPHTFAGLLNCYYMAIPFFRNTLLGDLFYSGIFFGGYALLTGSRLSSSSLRPQLVHGRRWDNPESR